VSEALTSGWARHLSFQLDMKAEGIAVTATSGDGSQSLSSLTTTTVWPASQADSSSQTWALDERLSDSVLCPASANLPSFS